MLIKTRHFGEIELNENKIIHFDQGIFGFEKFKDYTILYDIEGGEELEISWLQSIEEPTLSLPVISPFLIKEDYNPEIEDDFITSLGAFTDDNVIVLVTITVPPDFENITANLRAPIIVNSDTKKGNQIIVQNPEYEVKYHLYQYLTTKGGK